jgi:AcrR family transcriptional regulator
MVRTVKDPETRRAEIVETARKLFQSRTYDQTSMQDVMQECGIAKGTIYYYFKSKEELLDAVIDNMADEAISQMQNVLDNASGNALERLKLLIAAGRIADEKSGGDGSTP